MSADTRHTAVMGAALRAGAPIINDVEVVFEIQVRLKWLQRLMH